MSVKGKKLSLLCLKQNKETINFIISKQNRI